MPSTPFPGSIFRGRSKSGSADETILVTGDGDPETVHPFTFVGPIYYGEIWEVLVSQQPEGSGPFQFRTRGNVLL